MKIEEFEAARWETEGWSRQREQYVDRLKGQHAQLTKRRMATYQWAISISNEVQAAYAKFNLDIDERIGGTRLAAQLSAQGVRTQRGVDPLKMSDRGKAWADALVSETDVAMIDEAVLECRTLMTAKCLSANFALADVGQLESEYLEIIADAIAIGRSLRNQIPLPRELLLNQAKSDAIEAARRQREDKPPVSMAVRERYWRDRPAPVKKVFDQST